MIKLIVQILFIVHLQLSKDHPQDNDNLIYWKNDSYLSWNDFMATYIVDTLNEATSTCSIQSHYSSNNGLQMKFEIYAVFIKDKSSTKSDTSQYLLCHEQGHFDITEIFARQMRKRIIESDFSLTNYKLRFDEIYLENEKRLNEYQDAYDLETNHSKNIINQKEWNIKIEEQLQQLVIYSDPLILKEILR